MFTKGVELTRQKSIKYCPEPYCHEGNPLCAICVTPDCCDNQTKWIHLSIAEHICSACYNRILRFYSFEKDSIEVSKWKQNWLRRSHENPSIYDFIVDKLLPVWHSCSKCGKWRQINRSKNINVCQANCGYLLPSSVAPCAVPEDARIAIIKKNPQRLLDSLKYRPLLQSGPYLPLYAGYHLDVVGLSPASACLQNDLAIYPSAYNDFKPLFHPFWRRSSLETAAGSMDPALMTLWEHWLFPGMRKETLRPIYLGLRNLMLTMWNADPRRPVDRRLLEPDVRCRGLVRIALLEHVVPEMVRVLSCYGYINYGFLSANHRPEIRSLGAKKTGPLRVVVIGAGVAGLAAANHLRGFGGIQVTVLEAQSDSERHSAREVLNAILEVHGSINNPLAVAAYQLNIDIRPLHSSHFKVFDSKGHEVPTEIDDYFQTFIYETFLDYVRAACGQDPEGMSNRSVQDVYQEFREKHINPTYKEYTAIGDIYLNELENRMLGGVPLDVASPENLLEPMMRGASAWGLRCFSGDDFEPSLGSWSVLADRLEDSIQGMPGGKVYKVEELKQEEDGEFVLYTTASERLVADRVLVTADGLEGVPGLLKGESDNVEAYAVLFKMVLPNDWSPPPAFAIMDCACPLIYTRSDGANHTLVTTRVFGRDADLENDDASEIVQECTRGVTLLNAPVEDCIDLDVINLCLPARPPGLFVPDYLRNLLYLQRPTAPASLSDSYAAGLDLATQLLIDLI